MDKFEIDPFLAGCLILAAISLVVVLIVTSSRRR